MWDSMHLFTNTDHMQKASYKEVANCLFLKECREINYYIRIFCIIKKKVGHKKDDKEMVDDSDEDSKNNDEFLNLFCSDSEDSEFSDIKLLTIFSNFVFNII